MKRTSRGLITPRAYLQAQLQGGTNYDFDMEWAPTYSEPGYVLSGDQGILFANWNAQRGDETPCRLEKMAEHVGYAIEWSDEWAICDDCSGAVRTCADSYGWQRSYAEIGGNILCHACIKEDPTVYLEALEGNHKMAETMRLPLAEHGYVKLNQDSYEHGWHPGQNDAPEVVATSLRERGVTRFLFQLDDVGQFDTKFSVWVHEDEIALTRGAEVKSALPYDPGTEMAKALRGEPTPHYHVETRTLTPEEFLDEMKKR